jgi:hypothetical protein
VGHEYYFLQLKDWLTTCQPPTHLSIWACTIRDVIAAENPKQVGLHRITPWNHRATMFIAGHFHGRNVVVYLRRCTGREYQNLHVVSNSFPISQTNVLTTSYLAWDGLRGTATQRANDIRAQAALLVCT